MATAVNALPESRTTELVRAPIYRLTKMINAVGMAVLAVMMFLMALDVILRYAFNKPIPGSLENTQFMLAIVVSFGLAYTAMNKGHVTIDLLTSKMSPRIRFYFGTLNSVFSLVMVGLITWQLTGYGHMMQSANITSSVLRTPVYPFIYATAFGFAMLALVYLYDTFENTVKFLKTSRWTGWLLLLAVTALLSYLCVTIVMDSGSLFSLSTITAGIVGIVLLVILLFSGMPIGMVMAIVGFLGMSYIAGSQPGLSSIGSSPYSTVSTYSFTVIPLFVLMGSFCFFSGLSRDIYFAVYIWIGHLPGGLAMATFGACAGFSAICGSSPATVATMGTVAYPEMKKYRYDSRLATGCISAGGGLGVLIPPSIILAIYGILTEQSIGKLFLAGIIPGILSLVLLVLTTYIICLKNPELGPRGAISTYKERFASLKGTWGVLALFLLVMGGIYFGVFTPTEAAGVGAFGALLFALSRRKLGWTNFKASLLDTGSTTSMCFLILVGATVLGYFLAITRLPYEISMFITALEVSRYLVFAVIFLIYFLLGMIMSTIAMIILTVPIFFPIMMDLGFHPIWFGVIVVKVTEIAMISPPVGINVFVMKGIAKDVSMYTIYRGVIPFLISEIVAIIILLFVPQVTTWLPEMMRGPG